MLVIKRLYWYLRVKDKQELVNNVSAEASNWPKQMFEEYNSD